MTRQRAQTALTEEQLLAAQESRTNMLIEQQVAVMTRIKEICTGYGFSEAGFGLAEETGDIAGPRRLSFSNVTPADNNYLLGLLVGARRQRRYAEFEMPEHDGKGSIKFASLNELAKFLNAHEQDPTKHIPMVPEPRSASLSRPSNGFAK